MFLPLQYDAGKIVELPLVTAQTITKGMALIATSGYITHSATTTTEDVMYVAMADKVSTASGDLVACLPVKGVRFEADCDDVVSIVDRFTRCDLASSSTLNPDATTEKIFWIEEIVGEAEVSKKVIGYFDRFTAT